MGGVWAWSWRAEVAEVDTGVAVEKEYPAKE